MNSFPSTPMPQARMGPEILNLSMAPKCYYANAGKMHKLNP